MLQAIILAYANISRLQSDIKCVKIALIALTSVNRARARKIFNQIIIKTIRLSFFIYILRYCSKNKSIADLNTF